MRDSSADRPTAPMTSKLVALTFASRHPARLATFWQTVLGWEAGPQRLVRPDEFAITFRQSELVKTGKNPMHLDLTSSSLEDQRQTVARALDAGARPIDVGQRPDEHHVVLCDPEGNEFCVVEPGNGFLEGCGVLGCVSGDGSQQVGYFWGAALGWPLVWDRDRETAIQSPDGGSKLSWGGEEGVEHLAHPQLHYALAAIGDRDAEVERLTSLGATLIGDDGDTRWLADPDGGRFRIGPAGWTP